MPKHQQLVEQIAQLAQRAGWFLTTAESCTGGGIAKALTEISGSSAWFGAGWVTYSNQAKQQLLNVSSQSLELDGAVSASVVKQMVRGACINSGANLAVAVSGIAGPEGGSLDKPVGTVWLAWGDAIQQTAQQFNFTGDRRAIREASIDAALAGLVHNLSKLS